MADKYGKYIITDLKRKFTSPYEKEKPENEQKEILALDSSIIKGAFCVESLWFYPDKVNNQNVDVNPHKHDYDEVLALFGTDTKNPYDLGGEVEAWLGDEKHIINKSCIIFLPKGLQHGPFKFTKMVRPIFHFSAGLSESYLGSDKK